MKNMFKLQLDQKDDYQQLNIGFIEGQTATNQDLVAWVGGYLEGLAQQAPMGGPLLKVDGACSIPLAYVIAHKVSHLYAAVAVYDPKLSGYVVVSSHGSALMPGELIP